MIDDPEKVKYSVGINFPKVPPLEYCQQVAKGSLNKEYQVKVTLAEIN